MQTFLPYESFARSAAVLDRPRLGKQRVEVLQILRTLSGETSGWLSHPAVRMWRGYEGSLIRYGMSVCHEWRTRGYKDTCMNKIAEFTNVFPTFELHPTIMGKLLKTPSPVWLGWPAFHLSHQSNLLRKNVAHYGPIFPHVPNDLEYVWPGRTCPDDGACHHGCNVTCWRVRNCAPLTASGWDDWPDAIKAENL